MDILGPQPGFNDLPPEILTAIFEKLSARERSHIRRVCRRWYHSANVKSILQTEKLVLHNIYEIDDIVGVLATSKRAHMNLEFRYVTFGDRIAPFWRDVGHRIRRLEFTFCTVGDRNLEELVVHCRNLEHFSWFYSVFSASTTTDTVFAYLVDTKTIRNRSLTSLQLHLYDNRYPRMSNYVLGAMFEIFPAISDITLVCDSPTALYFYPVFAEPQMHSSLETLTFSTLLAKLKTTPKRIRKLNLSTNHEWARKNNFFIFTLNLVPNLTSLREISIQMTVNSDPTHRQTIKTFFANLPLLQRSICRFEFDSAAAVDDSQFVGAFLRISLDGSPNLTHLGLSYTRKIRLPRDVFVKMVESRLKALDLEFSDLSVEGDGERPLCNASLERLGLVLWARNADVVTLFLKTFVNLRYLKTSESSATVLNTMADHQTRMMEIKLMAGTYSRSAPPRDTHPAASTNAHSCCYCAYKLKNLQTFEMNLKSSRDALQIFSIVASRNLRKLIVRMPGGWQVCSKIIKSLRHLSELESVEWQCECKTFFYDNWLEVCSKLKKLRYLLIDDRSKMSHTQFENMFFCCPSLRAVKCGLELYYYDVIRNNIKRRPQS